MKINKYKIIFIIPFLLLIMLMISCKNNKKEYIKFDNEINLYNLNIINDNDISFESLNNSYIIHDDHVLELGFNIKIINNKNDDVNIKLNDSKAYGNDELLIEEILIKYNHDNKEDNELFNKCDFNLKEEESKTFDFKLVIQDGNPSCKYNLEFNINNTKLHIYSYEEGYELNEFLYVHNPLYVNSVLEDAEVDKNAVFGFKPNSTGSIKIYAENDWTDGILVQGAKEDRIAYIEENDKRIKELENKLRKENKNIEEIARACSNLRNQIRLEQYKDNPKELQQLKQRNLEKYGHEEGPLPEELYVNYNNSWEMVLEKCYSTNRAMDACCGVYDMYFNMYTPLAY